MNKESLSSKINLEEETEKNTPLSDEELSSLIKASREETFKIKEIKNEVSEDFKKVSLHDIAKKYNKKNEAKKQDKNEKKIEEIENKEINKDIKEDKENNKGDKKNDITKGEGSKDDVDREEKTKEEGDGASFEEKKIIEEEEHLKIIEAAKKEAFEKGKETAYSEVKEGADASIARLNSISDKIAKTDQLDLTELENLISDKIISLSSELTGKIIKAVPTEFLKKIKSFIATLDNNDGKIKIFISDDDYKVLEKNKDIKGKLKEMNITNKAELINGEVELLVNGIRIKQKLER